MPGFRRYLVICTRNKLFNVISRLSTTSVDRNCAKAVGDSSNHLRLAQASEIFRSQFYESTKLPVSLSCHDLDELIISERTRPSILLGPLQLAGSVLGVVAKYAPVSFSKVLVHAVDDAAIQIYNDSIRAMQDSPDATSDIKEALKYHRDIKASDENEKEVADRDPLSSIFGRKEMIALGIKNFLSLSKTI